MTMHITGILDEIKQHFSSKKKLSAAEKTLLENVEKARRSFYTNPIRASERDRYSENDLLDLELHYGNSLVRDERALDLIAALRAHRAAEENNDQAIYNLRDIADSINGELEEWEGGGINDDRFANRGALRTLKGSQVEAIEEKILAPLRKLSDRLNEEVAGLE